MDGYEFDSQSEANRYGELVLMQQAGLIDGLELHPVFELQPRFKFGRRIVRPITYEADFRYREIETGQVVVEDVKGVETEVFRIKAKMMKYVHGIDVRLVRQSKSRA